MNHGSDLHIIPPVHAILLCTRLIRLARTPITAPSLLMDRIIDKRSTDSGCGDEKSGISLHFQVKRIKWWKVIVFMWIMWATGTAGPTLR